jgi:drug/metabolite transporter (DMT)-like permease
MASDAVPTLKVQLSASLTTVRPSDAPDDDCDLADLAGFHLGYSKDDHHADEHHKHHDVVAPPRSPLPGVRARAVGAALVAFSSLSFATASLGVREASLAGFSVGANTFYIGLVRFVGAELVVLLRSDWRASVFCRGQSSAFVLLVVMRQAVGCVSLVCTYAALARMPMGEATALLFTAPVWTTALAYCALGEAITRANVAGALVSCVGVGMVALGSTGEAITEAGRSSRALGTVMALIAAATLAALIVATRAIGARQPALVLTGWYGAALVLTGALLISATGVPELAPAGGASVRTWVLLLCSGVSSLLGNMALTVGLRSLEAGAANVLGTLEIVFAFGFQITVLGSKTTALSLAGAAVIIGAALGVSLQAQLGALLACRRGPDWLHFSAGERPPDFARSASSLRLPHGALGAWSFAAPVSPTGSVLPRGARHSREGVTHTLEHLTPHGHDHGAEAPKQPAHSQLGSSGSEGGLEMVRGQPKRGV